MDRNSIEPANLTVSTTSLSARRAWIEIIALFDFPIVPAVALRKESVDRNYIIKVTGEPPAASLSARRAWIEIILDYFSAVMRQKSLSARRAWIEIPAGCWRDARRASLSARRAWIEIL